MMRVTLENETDGELVDWAAVADSIARSARKEIAKAFDQAAKEIGKLAPGEKRTVLIVVGEIEISREFEKRKTVEELKKDFILPVLVCDQDDSPEYQEAWRNFLLKYPSYAVHQPIFNAGWKAKSDGSPAA
jgi:hypothetical protein